MFVAVCTYRARAGEEDAVIALHEDWQRNRRAKAKGYLSGELLNDVRDPQAFITIARFESRAAALMVAEDPEQITWYRRLVSLAEGQPTFTCYHNAWPAR
jgi:heme-degrading monooxygenase HmoA